MKTELLRELGLSDEQIRAVQAESGKDVQAEKEKTREAEAKLHEVSEAKDAIEAECGALRAEDAAGLKAEIARLQGEISQRDEASRQEQLERELLVRFNSAVGENKFINKLTRDGIFEAFKTEIAKEGAPSDDVIYAEITRDMESIYESGHPMVDIPSINDDCGKIDEAEVRTVMGLPLV